jgi:CRP-like cAMP-binding protein
MKPVAMMCGDCVLRDTGRYRPMTGQDRILFNGVSQKQVVMPPGADFVSEGARSRGLFTICDGWAFRYQRLRAGSRQILDVLLPGDTVALAAVLLGASRYSVQALTSASVCMLNGRQFVSLLKTSPGFAFGVLRVRLEEERRADARLTMLGRMRAEERVGYFAMDIHDRLRRRRLVQGQRCPFPLRRMDLADAVGLSKVHVLRALRELRALSLMEITGRELIIPDVARLADYTGFQPA